MPLFKVSLALLAVCAAGCDDPEGYPARRALCTDDLAVTHDALSKNGATPLCEHQGLVAALRPDGPVAVPFRLVSDETIEFCFDDDNGEIHRAVLVAGDFRPIELTAGSPCVHKRLSPGVYQLQLNHERPNQDDPTPDVIHTRWLPAASRSRGEPSRLLLSSNACPGCTLPGEWPYLLDDDNKHVYGYVGNYDGAVFSGSKCSGRQRFSDHEMASTCVLGLYGPSSFTSAKLDSVGFGLADVSKVRFENDRSGGPVTSFRNASFHAMHLAPNLGSPSGHLQADFTGADFQQASFGNATVLSGTLLDIKLVEFNGEYLQVEDATLHLDAYRTFIQTKSRYWGHNTIVIRTGDDLSGVALDGARDTIRWPKRTDTGKVLLPGMSFAGAKLSNVSFECVDGGDLTGTKFGGATLDNVTFSNCDLTGAVFDGATLKNVVARKAAFAHVMMHDVVIDGLDLSGGALSGVLRLRNSTVAQRLVAIDAKISVDAEGLIAPKAKLFHATLSDARLANAQLIGADLGTAILDRTDFTGAHLDGAVLSGATGSGTIFKNTLLVGKATLDAAHFTAATFDSARLDGVSFRTGRVCGGSANGIVLDGADLANTVVPLTSNSYTVDGMKFDCHGVQARDTAATNNLTTCPDGTSGPCATEPSWIPLGLTPMCCNPWTDPTCKRKATGQVCATACDCASLKCTASICS